MADRTNPNDPKYSSNPDRYVFQDGLWQQTGGGGINLEIEEFWNDPNSAWTKDWDNAGKSMGYRPQEVAPDAPGGLVDTSQADEERRRTGVLLAQLQQQAASGSGAWEGSLADATGKASSSAMALGQSQEGVGYSSGLRNIGNAQGAVAQRAVGQGNMLRAQSQTGAQDQLAKLLAAQGSGDASQAAANAAAQQGISALNNSLASNANKQITKDSTSFGSMSTGAFSDGGTVPGKPMVGGDDPKNDTVSAMLSPGEIVIPRSHASTPEQAADFVRALQARGPQYMNAGGTAGDGTGLRTKAATPQDTLGGALSVFLPHVGAAARGTGVKQEAPSIANGGLLDTGNYDATRKAQLANADLIQQRANGAGPSVAPQQMQDATDENIAAAMQQRRGGMAAGDVLQRTAASNQGAAGGSAATAGNEQAAGQSMLGNVLTGQRASDLAIATAKQQAAFRQTQINAGLGLEQQAALRSIFSGAGQATMGAVSAAGGRGDTYSLSDSNTPDFEQGLSADEWGAYPGEGNGSSGSADLHDRNDLWHGGKVSSDNGSGFAAAYGKSRGYANGGAVAFGGAGGPPVVYDAYGNPMPPMASYQPPTGAGGGGGYSVPPRGSPMDGAQGGSGQQVPVTESPTFTAPAPAYAYAGNAPSSSGAGGGPGVESPQTVFDPTRGGNVPDVGQGAQSGGNAPKPTQSLRVADMSGMPASFRPKGAASPELVPPVQPPPPAAQPPRVAGGGGGAGMPGLADIRKGTAMGQAGATAGADVAIEEGRAKAAALGAYEDQLKAHALDDRVRTDAARVRTDELMSGYRAAQDEMRNINATVDPGRYWASRSTGGKIAGIIGLALGALGTGPDGINRAAAMMNQAIDRDLEAQKAEHTIRLQKGKASIDAAQSAYAMERQRFGDDAAASSAAKASLLGLAENELKKIAAGSAGPAAQAQAQALAGQLQVQKGQLENQIANTAFDNNTSRMAAEAQRAAAGQKAAGTPAEAKAIREAVANHSTMSSTVGRLEHLIGDTNAVTEKVGARAEEMKTLAGSLLLQVKTAEGLGALDAGAIKVAEQIIGDPNATFTLDATKIAKLRALLGQSKLKVESMAGAAR